VRLTTELGPKSGPGCLTYPHWPHFSPLRNGEIPNLWGRVWGAQPSKQQPSGPCLPFSAGREAEPQGAASESAGTLPTRPSQRLPALPLPLPPGSGPAPSLLNLLRYSTSEGHLCLFLWHGV
jgi:hypothetical protein